RLALLAGELDGRPEPALFYSYLAGEFLRRAGQLARASEWLKSLLALIPADSPLGLAAGEQLAWLRRQAGEQANFLAALGEDGEALAKVREIAGAGALP
ncbi:MAG: hypothetical protein LBV15_03085, partial [Planctomycetota bacterium]|nr:hypothetical protein [Planctomycetota bacterium]